MVNGVKDDDFENDDIEGEEDDDVEDGDIEEEDRSQDRDNHLCHTVAMHVETSQEQVYTEIYM